MISCSSALKCGNSTSSPGWTTTHLTNLLQQGKACESIPAGFTSTKRILSIPRAASRPFTQKACHARTQPRSAPFTYTFTPKLQNQLTGDRIANTHAYGTIAAAERNTWTHFVGADPIAQLCANQSTTTVDSAEVESESLGEMKHSEGWPNMNPLRKTGSFTALSLQHAMSSSIPSVRQHWTFDEEFRFDVGAR